MKKSKILKELKAIKELIGNNRVSAWNEDLSNPSDAVLLEDITDKNGEEVETAYNGWNEKLENLIAELEGEKKPTKLHKMVLKFDKYIATDDASYEEIEAEIIRLQNLEDQNETLDHALSDKFCPCAKFEWDFTIKSFLDQIDEVGYE
jgi:hypothetical protein